MKKILSILLTLALLMCAFPAAVAEEETYKLGDKMEDFTATLSDGTEVNLYGLLKEKKAVLLNLWADYCGPCKMEFPHMAQAYSEMSDDIGIIALSVDPNDTDEVVQKLREELGLGDLPMGLDTVGLSKRISHQGIPVSVVVDRNGVICFIEEGAITDSRTFKRLFDLFTGDDYSEPVIVYELPQAMPSVEAPTAEALSGALGITDEHIQVDVVDMPHVWPIAPSEDGSYAVASNGLDKGTISAFGLNVQAKAGEALAYEYSTSFMPVMNYLRVYVNDELYHTHAGNTDWTGDYVAFDEAGDYEIVFMYAHGEDAHETSAALRALRLIDQEGKDAIDAARFVGPKKVLPGEECTIELVEGELKPVTVVQNGVEETGDTPLQVMQSDSLLFKIKVGESINDEQAYIMVGMDICMLKDLEQAEDGYLLRYKPSGEPSLMPSARVVRVYPTINIDDGEAVSSDDICWMDSELDLNNQMELMIAMNEAYGGPKNYSIAWHYTDGSPKQSEGQTEELPSGMGRYVIAVTDTEGRALQDVTIQICDESTCQLAVTDEAGMVTHVATSYAYEIHVLRVPEGYARPTDAYTFPQEGGDMVITLEKADN